MPVVCAVLGDIVHVSAGQAAILTGITVTYASGLLNVVLSEQEIGCAGIVEVEERIVLVHSVYGKHVRGSRGAIDGRVAIARLGVHDRTGSGLHDVAEIIAGIGHVLDLLRSE